MAQKAAVYLAGVDTLIMNAKMVDETVKPSSNQEVPSELEEQLARWQEEAQVQNEVYATPWKHEKYTLNLEPRGTANYRYLLKNGLIDLMIGPRLQNGSPVRVRFSSEYLWRRGIDAAVVHTHAFLMDLLDTYLHLQLAEIHLCADVTGLPIPKHYERVFVCRARKERPKKKGLLDSPVYYDHLLETLQFSGHGSPISATIYDKPAEIEQKSREKRWFYDLWRQRGWNGVLPERSKEKDAYRLPVQDTSSLIWRVECRLKREGLHEMEIEEVYDAIGKIPALWAYCVGHVGQQDGWLRMVTPNRRDSNRYRWNTAPSWQVVQKAFADDWRGYEDMADIQRDRKRAINMDRAEKAIAGYFTTYGAWMQDELGSDDDLSVVMQRVYSKILLNWEKSGVDFQTLKRLKEHVYHLV